MSLAPSGSLRMMAYHPKEDHASMITLRRRTIALLMVAAALAIPTAGLPCDSSACFLTTRGEGSPLRKGTIQLDLSWRYLDKERRLLGSRTTPDVWVPQIWVEGGQVWPQFEREERGHESFLQAELSYGLTAKTSLQMTMPLLADKTYDVLHGPEGVPYATLGFGDTLIGVRHALSSGRRDQWVGGLALKLPTGRSDRVSDYDTLIINPGIQAGSGSLDVVASLAYSRQELAGVDWTVSTSHQFVTRNDRGYRFGDETIAAITASRALSSAVVASLQLKGGHRGRDDFLDQPVPSSGWSYLAVVPGARVRVTRGLSVYGFVQFPVYQYVNEFQLGSSVMALTGISKTF